MRLSNDKVKLKLLVDSIYFVVLIIFVVVNFHLFCLLCALNADIILYKAFLLYYFINHSKGYKIKTLLSKTVSIGALFIGLSDILEPIYSFGAYLVYAILIFNVYLIYLATKYKSAEELINNEKAFAHLDMFKDFYKEYWKSGVIIVFLVLLTISATGAYFTNKNKNDGGFLASNFEEVQDIQEKLSSILKIQKEINKTTKDIKTSVDLIKGHYERISLEELVQSLKTVENPLNELTYVLNNKYIDKPYFAKDINYILKLAENTNNYYVNQLAIDALNSCKNNSFSENEMISYLSSIKKVTDNGNFTITFDKVPQIKKCLKDHHIENPMTILLSDKDNYFFYHINKKNDKETKMIYNSCSKSIEKDFFKNIKIGENNTYDLKNFLDDIKIYGTNCVDKDSIILLNEKISRNKFLKSLIEWTKIGITNKEVIKRWIDIGLDKPILVNQWLEININEPNVVDKFQKNKIFPFVIQGYQEKGIIDSLEILEWINSDISPDEATQFKLNNIDIEEAKIWKSLSDLFIPSTIKDWKKLGIKEAKVAKQWAEIGLEHSFMVKDWIKLGINNPKVVKEWLDAGVESGLEVNRLIKKGINTPKKAMEYLKNKNI